MCVKSIHVSNSFLLSVFTGTIKQTTISYITVYSSTYSTLTETDKHTQTQTQPYCMHRYCMQTHKTYVQLVRSHRHHIHTECPPAKGSFPTLAQLKRQTLKDTEDTERVKKAPKPNFQPENHWQRGWLIGSKHKKSFEPAHPLSKCAVKVLTVRWYDSVISELTTATAERVRIMLLKQRETLQFPISFT